MRPIYHQVESRVKTRIFVATLALLVQRLLHQQMREANIDFSPSRAIEALRRFVMSRSICDGQNPRSGISAGSPDARRMLKALEIKSTRPPAPTKGAETVM